MCATYIYLHLHIFRVQILTKKCFNKFFQSSDRKNWNFLFLICFVVNHNKHGNYLLKDLFYAFLINLIHEIESMWLIELRFLKPKLVTWVYSVAKVKSWVLLTCTLNSSWFLSHIWSEWWNVRFFPFYSSLTYFFIDFLKISQVNQKLD